MSNWGTERCDQLIRSECAGESGTTGEKLCGGETGRCTALEMSFLYTVIIIEFFILLILHRLQHLPPLIRAVCFLLSHRCQFYI